VHSCDLHLGLQPRTCVEKAHVRDYVVTAGLSPPTVLSGSSGGAKASKTPQTTIILKAYISVYGWGYLGGTIQAESSGTAEKYKSPAINAISFLQTGCRKEDLYFRKLETRCRNKTWPVEYLGTERVEGSHPTEPHSAAEPKDQIQDKQHDPDHP
jgi:hypothetical protein